MRENSRSIEVMRSAVIQRRERREEEEDEAGYLKFVDPGRAMRTSYQRNSQFLSSFPASLI